MAELERLVAEGTLPRPPNPEAVAMQARALISTLIYRVPQDARRTKHADEDDEYSPGVTGVLATSLPVRVSKMRSAASRLNATRSPFGETANRPMSFGTTSEIVRAPRSIREMLASSETIATCALAASRPNFHGAFAVRTCVHEFFAWSHA